MEQQQHFSVSGSGRSLSSSSSSSSNVLSEGEETTPGVEMNVYGDSVDNAQDPDRGSGKAAEDGGNADHDKETPDNDDDDDDEQEEEDDMVNTQTTRNTFVGICFSHPQKLTLSLCLFGVFFVFDKF